MNNTTGTIDIDGEIFGIERIQLLRQENKWRLTITGQERRLLRFNNELCAPRILIPNIPATDTKETTEIILDSQWNEDSSMVDDTYITLFGEGFSIIECKLTIRNREDFLTVDLDAKADLPLTHDRDWVPVRIAAETSLRESTEAVLEN
jgi:hypothetical protein